MNVLAKELNDELERSGMYSFLSERGKRMYFPKGIVAQSAEAGEKAKRVNATVGTATRLGQPFYLGDIYKYFENDFKPSEIFNYAPGGGDKSLRSLWKEEMVRKNPGLEGKLTSGCIVTGGLTHTISIAATLFADEGDEIFCPDLFWDNYDLIFSDLAGARLVTFPFFKDGRLNSQGLRDALLSSEKNEVRLILNFPNNPTGYTPSRKEMKDLVDALKDVAKKKKILVIVDDAYFGLFYEEETEKESLFSYLADADENIFVIKGDAATKEDMVWGFRIGFITYAGKALDEKALDALEKKTLGAIRCTVSNCDRPGQSLLLRAKKGENYEKDKKELFSVIKERYEEVKRVLKKYEGNDLLTPYPFNSGYFMAFDTHNNSAEELRRYLLDKYQIGAINIFDRTFRLAYCSVEKENIESLIDCVYRAAEELWK